MDRSNVHLVIYEYDNKLQLTVDEVFSLPKSDKT